MKSKSKDTIIGKIPIDWRIGTLNDISSITDGSHYSPKPLIDGTKIIATVKDMRYNKFDFSESKRISDSDFDTLIRNGCSPNKGDILISKDGTIGLCLVYDQELTIVLLSSIAIIRLDDGFDPYFYRYYLVSTTAQEIIRSGYTTGSAIHRIVLRDLKRIPIPIPPKEVQRNIGAILSSLDRQIAVSHEINNSLEKIVNTLFRRWFIDFEFPNEQGKPYVSNKGEMVDSELGEIPNGWEIRKFSEVVEILSGGTPRTNIPEYWNGKVKWVSVVDTEEGPYIIETQKTITELGVSESNAKLLPLETVVITARGTVGNCSIMSEPMAINQSCYGLRGRDNIGQIFVFHLLKTKLRFLLTNVHGTVFDTITRSTFDTIEVIMPTRELTSKFENISRPFFDEILRNRYIISTLSNVRDLLLPKLMSGEITI